MTDLRQFGIERVPHGQIIERCWELHDNRTIYDAAYVALAEALKVILVTTDRRLARAPGTTCLIEVLA